ncbi:hypothetical protein ACHAQA_000921 [Verticillium albo-atrum]
MAITSSINGSLLQCHAALELAAAISRGACPHAAPPPCRCSPRETYLGALRHADEAHRFATDFRRYQGMARAQVYRGHCFRGLGEWRLAHRCYVRGASVRGPGWGEVDIEGLTRECQDKMEEEERQQQQQQAQAAVRGRRGAAGRTVSFDPLVVEHIFDHASLERLPERVADGVPGVSGAGSGSGSDSSYWVRNEDGRIVAFRCKKPDLRRVEGTPYLRWEKSEIEAIERDERDD